MRLALVGCLLSGCGRLAFDPLADANLFGDVNETVGVTCPIVTPPPILTFAGFTFEYTSSDNMNKTVPGVMIIIRDSTTGIQLNATPSHSAGDYSMQYLTFEQPREILAEYTSIDHLPTFVWTGPLDSDVAGAAQPLWRVGDAPLWNDIAMDTIYGSAGVSRDPTLATVNVAIRDCEDNIIEGVVVTMDPAPELLAYQAVDGTPDPLATQTVGPFAHAFGFNAAVAETTITASAPGYEFPTLTLTPTQARLVSSRSSAARRCRNSPAIGGPDRAARFLHETSRRPATRAGQAEPVKGRIS